MWHLWSLSWCGISFKVRSTMQLLKQKHSRRSTACLCRGVARAWPWPPRVGNIVVSHLTLQLSWPTLIQPGRHSLPQKQKPFGWHNGIEMETAIIWQRSVLNMHAFEMLETDLACCCHKQKETKSPGQSQLREIRTGQSPSRLDRRAGSSMPFRGWKQLKKLTPTWFHSQTRSAPNQWQMVFHLALSLL